MHFSEMVPLVLGFMLDHFQGMGLGFARLQVLRHRFDNVPTHPIERVQSQTKMALDGQPNLP
jgi:hypothetical protein